MMKYSVQLRDRIFVKGYGFLCFAKNIGKNISKHLAANIARNFIMLKDLQQMHLRLLQKEKFKRQHKQLVIWLVIKLLTELRKFQKIRNKIVRKQLQISKIKKIPKERYISPDEIQKITDDLGLI